MPLRTQVINLNSTPEKTDKLISEPVFRKEQACRLINCLYGEWQLNKSMDTRLKNSGGALLKSSRSFALFCLLCLTFFAETGCQSASEQRLKADKVAEDIIREKTQQALGQAQEFNIERPSDILRRRLLLEQGLVYAGNASLGSDQLSPIAHWPEANYPQAEPSLDPVLLLEKDKPLQLSLLQALQVGARNSFDYQSQKEDVFREALALDLERNEFRNIFVGQVESLLSSDTTGAWAESGVTNSAGLGVSRKLASGAELGAALAIDLANLLTAGGMSSLGIAGDATISIPLLRGSGKHIVTEPLTQAERNVVYAIYGFEQFKKTFAVDIAAGYLAVLRQLDEVKNSRENYRSLIASTRRSRRLADAGKMNEIEVDQAQQNELRARDRWIRAEESYKRSLDSFKSLLGLPPDAMIELDRADLEKLIAPTSQIMQQIAEQEQLQQSRKTPPADAPIELVEPSRDNAGPLEIEGPTAIKLALNNRLDFRVVQGEVYDAQRAVVVAADALGAELTLFGSAELGQRRTITTADLDNAQFRADKAVYSALLTLDLPFERTQERNIYRNSFISLERAVRDVQILEDRIKLSVLNELRDMLQARESLYIQAKAVYVAQKRVKSVNLFLEAGRAQMRDLLEAQEALLSAQNGLTAAVVDYRIAELQLQRDTGLLKVDEKGLWQEYRPEGVQDVGK
jgi:outer membrane protein TolC